MVRLRAPVEPQTIMSVLGVKLLRVGNFLPPVEHYEGTMASAPFEETDFKTNRRTLLALLVLKPRPGAPIAERSLNLRQYGPMTTSDINPRVPPEGTQSLAHTMNGVRVSWTFTMRSRVLTGIRFEWPKSVP